MAASDEQVGYDEGDPTRTPQVGDLVAMPSKDGEGKMLGRIVRTFDGKQWAEVVTRDGPEFLDAMMLEFLGEDDGD